MWNDATSLYQCDDGVTHSTILIDLYHYISTHNRTTCCPPVCTAEDVLQPRCNSSCWSSPQADDLGNRQLPAALGLPRVCKQFREMSEFHNMVGNMSVTRSERQSAAPAATTKLKPTERLQNNTQKLSQLT